MSSAGPTVRPKLPAIWRARIAPKLAAVVLRDLDVRKLERWERWLLEEANGGRGYAAETVRSTWGCLSSALKRSGLESQPWAGFRLCERRSPLSKGKEVAATHEHIVTLLKAAALQSLDDCVRLPDLAERVVALLVLRLRPSEGIALSWSDVSWAAGLSVRVRLMAPEGWIRAAGGTGVGPGTRYHGDLRPQQLTKWPRTMGPFPPSHPLAVCLERQKALLIERKLFSEDGPVFPQLDGGFRHRYFIEPKRCKLLGEVVGQGRWVQQSFAYSAVLFQMADGASAVLGQPRTYANNALDDLARRAPAEVRPFMSYAWLDQLAERYGAGEDS